MYFVKILSIGLLIFLFSVSCSYQPERQPSDPPELLARVDFNKHTDGERYGNADVKRDFGSLASWGTYWPFQRVQIVQDDDPVRDKVLRVNYPFKKNHPQYDLAKNSGRNLDLAPDNPVAVMRRALRR